MRHWLTTHYAHQSPRHPYSIYLKERYRAAKAPLIVPGQRVAFYELKGTLHGRQGVVALGTVTAKIRPNKNREGGPDEGDQIWEWEIPCSDHRFQGFVERESLDKALGRRFSPRIPGGLMELNPEEFSRIETLFARAARV